MKQRSSTEAKILAAIGTELTLLQSFRVPWMKMGKMVDPLQDDSRRLLSQMSRSVRGVSAFVNLKKIEGGVIGEQVDFLGFNSRTFDCIFNSNREQRDTFQRSTVVVVQITTLACGYLN